MNIQRLSRYCLYIGIWLLVIINPTRIHAQSAGLSISPPVVEILLSPGKQLTQVFTIKTKGQAVTLTPNIHRVLPMGRDGQSQIERLPINPASIPLVIKSSHAMDTPIPVPSSTDEIRLTLSLEAATTDVVQDVYLALVITLDGSLDPGKTSQATASPGISALFLTTITPTGIMPINLEIIDLQLPLIHDTWDPLTLSPAIKNGAPIMIRPEGTLEVLSPSGRSLSSTTLYPNLVLGNTERLLQGTEPCTIEQGSVPCKPIPLTFTPKWSNIGPHRLVLTINTAGGSKLTQVERTVWFIPLKLSLISLVILLLGLGIWLHSRKHPKLPLDSNHPTQ